MLKKKIVFMGVIRFSVILLLITIFLIPIHLPRANPSQQNLTEVSSITAAYNSHIVDVSVVDHILYAVNDFEGISIYNVSDPSSPSLLGQCIDFYYTFTHSIFIEDDLAYTADYEDGFEIWNVSDTSNPEFIARYTSEAGASAGSTDAYKAGDLGFLASQNLGLEIINCSDSNTPCKISSYYANERVIRVYAVNELVFFSEAHNGFKILKINGDNYTELYHFPDSVSYQAFFVHDGLLYTTDTQFGFSIFDISDPTQLVKVGEKELGKSYGFVIEEHDEGLRAYVTTWESGLQILDISDPTEINFIAQYNDGGEDYNVAVSDGYIYVAEFSYGLEILKIGTIGENSSTNLGFEVFNFLFLAVMSKIFFSKKKKQQ